MGREKREREMREERGGWIIREIRELNQFPSPYLWDGSIEMVISERQEKGVQAILRGFAPERGGERGECYFLSLFPEEGSFYLENEEDKIIFLEEDDEEEEEEEREGEEEPFEEEDGDENLLPLGTTFGSWVVVSPSLLFCLCQCGTKSYVAAFQYLSSTPSLSSSFDISQQPSSLSPSPSPSPTEILSLSSSSSFIPQWQYTNKVKIPCHVSTSAENMKIGFSQNVVVTISDYSLNFFSFRKKKKERRGGKKGGKGKGKKGEERKRETQHQDDKKRKKLKIVSRNSIRRAEQIPHYPRLITVNRTIDITLFLDPQIPHCDLSPFLSFLSSCCDKSGESKAISSSPLSRVRFLIGDKLSAEYAHGVSNSSIYLLPFDPSSHQSVEQVIQTYQEMISLQSKLEQWPKRVFVTLTPSTPAATRTIKESMSFLKHQITDISKPYPAIYSVAKLSSTASSQKQLFSLLKGYAKTIFTARIGVMSREISSVMNPTIYQFLP